MCKAGKRFFNQQHFYRWQCLLLCLSQMSQMQDGRICGLKTPKNKVLSNLWKRNTHLTDKVCSYENWFAKNLLTASTHVALWMRTHVGTNYGNGGIMMCSYCTHLIRGISSSRKLLNKKRDEWKVWFPFFSPFEDLEAESKSVMLSMFIFWEKSFKLHITDIGLIWFWLYSQISWGPIDQNNAANNEQYCFNNVGLNIFHCWL